VPPTPAWGWSPSTSTTAVVPSGPEASSPPEAVTGDTPSAEADDEADPSEADANVPTEVDGETDTTTVQPTTDAGGAGGTGWGSPPPPSAPWDVPPPPVPGAPLAPVADQARNQRHRHRHLVGPGVFGVLLIWTGVAWLTGVGLTTGLAVGLVILGVGFVLGSFVGGSRALIFPALVVAAVLAITAIIDIPFSGPIGEQHWSPVSRSELQDTYEVSMGEGTLDLSDLGILRMDTEVRATAGLGHLIVLVREDQDLVVDTEVGAGETVVFGEEQNGVGFETHDAHPGDGRTLTLDLEVGMGQIEVRRVLIDGGDDVIDTTTSTSVLG
jgi:hypothetical protein